MVIVWLTEWASEAWTVLNSVQFSSAHWLPPALISHQFNFTLTLNFLCAKYESIRMHTTQMKLCFCAQTLLVCLLSLSCPSCFNVKEQMISLRQFPCLWVVHIFKHLPFTALVVFLSLLASHFEREHICLVLSEVRFKLDSIWCRSDIKCWRAHTKVDLFGPALKNSHGLTFCSNEELIFCVWLARN